MVNVDLKNLLEGQNIKKVECVLDGKHALRLDIHLTDVHETILSIYPHNYDTISRCDIPELVFKATMVEKKKVEVCVTT